MEVPKLWIQKQNQAEIEVNDAVPGMHLVSFDPGPPQPVQTFVAKPNVNADGENQIGDVAFGPTKPQLGFYFDGLDDFDFRVACGKVWSLLYDRDIIRLRDNIEPSKVIYAYAQAFENTKINWADMTFTVPFINPSGFRQSIIRSDGDWTNETAIGLNFADTVPKSTFSSSAFTVYNPSDVAIEPRQKGHDLIITVKAVGSPVITDKTTGHSIAYKGNMADADTLLINGATAFMNGSECGSKTDYGDIDLSKGNSNFEVTGCTLKSITFSYPFLYF